MTLKAALEQVEAEDLIQRVGIFIGPEGGLSNEELAQFETAGAQVVTLGPTILRAETAAVSSVGMLQYALNMD